MPQLYVRASDAVDIEEVARVLRASGRFDARVLPGGKTLVLHQAPRDLAQDIAALARLPAFLRRQAE